MIYSFIYWHTYKLLNKLFNHYCSISRELQERTLEFVILFGNVAAMITIFSKNNLWKLFFLPLAYTFLLSFSLCSL
jgi:hypothetical protein